MQDLLRNYTDIFQEPCMNYHSNDHRLAGQIADLQKFSGLEHGLQEEERRGPKKEGVGGAYPTVLRNPSCPGSTHPSPILCASQPTYLKPNGGS